jgi:hypothetical protein
MQRFDPTAAGGVLDVTHFRFKCSQSSNARVAALNDLRPLPTCLVK